MRNSWSMSRHTIPISCKALFETPCIMHNSYYILCHNSTIYLPTCLSNYKFCLFISVYLCNTLTTDIWNPQLIKSSHVLHEPKRIMYLVHVYPRYVFKAHLIIYLYPRASLRFHSVPRTNTWGCISVQSNSCHMHRPSHPPVRSTEQIRTVIITQISSLTFSLLHSHVCFSKVITNAENLFVTYYWLVMLFNTLCCVIHCISSLMMEK